MWSKAWEWLGMSWGGIPVLPRDLLRAMPIICIYMVGVSVASCWQMTVETTSRQFIQQWSLQSPHIPALFVHRDPSLVRERHVESESHSKQLSYFQFLNTRLKDKQDQTNVFKWWEWGANDTMNDRLKDRHSRVVVSDVVDLQVMSWASNK